MMTLKKIDIIDVYDIPNSNKRKITVSFIIQPYKPVKKEDIENFCAIYVNEILKMDGIKIENDIFSNIR